MFKLMIMHKKKNTKSLDIGDTFNYTTTLNGQTLNNWKVFYVDGDYTYIILDDYLPNAYISDSVKTTHNLYTSNTYGVRAIYSREDLLNAMATKANWDRLLTGTINGHAVNETRTANVWAMGSPTVDLWVNSWNATYLSDTLYIRYIETEDIDNINLNTTGYAIGYSANPTTNSISNMPNRNDTLYFPRNNTVDNCYGYWLASLSCQWAPNVMTVYYSGQIVGYNYDCDGNVCHFAFRPVVCLPSSVVNQ